MRDRVLDGLDVKNHDGRRSTGKGEGAAASTKSHQGKVGEDGGDVDDDVNREEITLDDFYKIFKFKNGMNDTSSGPGWTPLRYATLFNYGGEFLFACLSLSLSLSLVLFVSIVLFLSLSSPPPRLGRALKIMHDLIDAGADIEAPMLKHYPRFTHAEGMTTLHSACLFSSPEAVKVLLDRGASVWATAGTVGYPVPCCCVLEDNRDTLRTLLDHPSARKGPDGRPVSAKMLLEKRDNFGNTPLHFAAKRSSIACIEELLSRDASRTKMNGFGATPVGLGLGGHVAWYSERGAMRPRLSVLFDLLLLCFAVLCFAVLCCALVFLSSLRPGLFHFPNHLTQLGPKLTSPCIAQSCGRLNARPHCLDGQEAGGRDGPRNSHQRPAEMGGLFLLCRFPRADLKLAEIALWRGRELGLLGHANQRDPTHGVGENWQSRRCTRDASGWSVAGSEMRPWHDCTRQGEKVWAI